MSVRIANTTTSQDTQVASHSFVRPLLWLLLVVSATGNMVTSMSHLDVTSIVLGLLTLSFGTALVIHHYRGRR